MSDAHSEMTALVNRLWVASRMNPGNFSDADRAKLLGFGEKAMPTILTALERDAGRNDPNWNFAQLVKGIVVDMGIGATPHLEMALQRPAAKELPALRKQLEEMLCEIRKTKLPLPEKFRAVAGAKGVSQKSANILKHWAVLR